MRQYQRLRTELERLQEAAEELEIGCKPLVVLYSVDRLRSLPAEEQEPYLARLLVEKEAEREGSRLRVRSRRQEADMGAVVYFPLKGSRTINQESI